MRVLLGTAVQPNEDRYRLALESAGYSVVAEDQPQQYQESTVIALCQADSADAQLKVWRQQFARVRPIVTGDPVYSLRTQDLALAAAPALAANFTTEELLRAVAFVSRGNEWLLGELVRLDRNAKRLVDDELCEWVRSRPGIIGIVQIGRLTPILQLENVLRRLIAHAYTLLDRLPQQELSFEDIWNVTLLIAVPIKEMEYDRDVDTAKSLEKVTRDVTGSRKVILWLDRSLDEYFGPLGAGSSSWKLSSDDPLRVKLESLATNLVERNALEIIFKRRLSQEDIDELLKVLGAAND